MANVDEHRLIHLQHPKIVFHFGNVATEQVARPFARHCSHSRCRWLNCWHFAANNTNLFSVISIDGKKLRIAAKTYRQSNQRDSKLFVYKWTMSSQNITSQIDNSWVSWQLRWIMTANDIRRIRGGYKQRPLLALYLSVGVRAVRKIVEFDIFDLMIANWRVKMVFGLVSNWYLFIKEILINTKNL